MNFRLLVEQILEEGKVMDQVQALLKTGIDLSKDTPRPESAPQDSEIFPLPVVRNGRLGYIVFNKYRVMGFSAFMPKEYKPGYTEKTKDYCGVFDINNFFGAFDNLVARLEALPLIQVPKVKEKRLPKLLRIYDKKDTIKPVEEPPLNDFPFKVIRNGRLGLIFKYKDNDREAYHYESKVYVPGEGVKRLSYSHSSFQEVFDIVSDYLNGTPPKRITNKLKIYNPDKENTKKPSEEPSLDEFPFNVDKDGKVVGQITIAKTGKYRYRFRALRDGVIKGRGATNDFFEGFDVIMSYANNTYRDRRFVTKDKEEPDTEKPSDVELDNIFPLKVYKDGKYATIYKQYNSQGRFATYAACIPQLFFTSKKKQGPIYNVDFDKIWDDVIYTLENGKKPPRRTVENSINWHEDTEAEPPLFPPDKYIMVRDGRIGKIIKRPGTNYYSVEIGGRHNPLGYVASHTPLKDFNTAFKRLDKLLRSTNIDPETKRPAVLPYIYTDKLTGRSGKIVYDEGTDYDVLIGPKDVAHFGSFGRALDYMKKILSQKIIKKTTTS